MASNYKSKGVTLTQLYPMAPSGCTIPSFKLSDYGYAPNKSDERFIKYDPSNPWGSSPAKNVLYKKNNKDLPFASWDSSPVPIPDSNSTYLPYAIAKSWSSGTHYVRYNPDNTDSPCEWSDDGRTWYPLGLKFKGVYIALQGAGGGGGGGNVNSDALAAASHGAGGGGAGGFALVYVNLSKYPREAYRIVIGNGGSCGHGTNWGIYYESASGNPGGDTDLYSPRGGALAYATGGWGGDCGYYRNAAGGSGGYGWSYNNSEIYPLCTLNGRSGGGPGGVSGYVFGIPYGWKAGSQGGSFWSEQITIPFSPNLNRNVRDDGKGRGIGEWYDEAGRNAYTSCGGGGGAAVCSCSSGIWSNGYGYGGQGGWMNCLVYTQGPPILGQRGGGPGGAFILKAKSLDS